MSTVVKYKNPSPFELRRHERQFTKEEQGKEAKTQAYSRPEKGEERPIAVWAYHWLIATDSLLRLIKKIVEKREFSRASQGCAASCRR